MMDRANDNLPKDVAFSLDYLKTGGLGEVIGLTDLARRDGHPKVQMDSDMAVALCMLAADALDHATVATTGGKGTEILPADVPQDVWDTAGRAVAAMPPRSPFKCDVELAIARAIFAERERCATNIERRDGEIPDRSGIVHELRIGVVIDERGIKHIPYHSHTPIKSPVG